MRRFLSGGIVLLGYGQSVSGFQSPILGYFLMALGGLGCVYALVAFVREKAHAKRALALGAYTPMSDKEIQAGLQSTATVARMQERWMEFDGECEALGKRIALVAPGQERARLTLALERAERNRAKAWAWLNEG